MNEVNETLRDLLGRVTLRAVYIATVGRRDAPAHFALPRPLLIRKGGKTEQPGSTALRRNYKSSGKRIQ
jgi:hypothetical protein